MTDKEVRRLKRHELIEIMFYLQQELDSLKEENAALKARVDELSRTQNSLSEEALKQIVDTIRTTTQACLSHDDSNDTSEEL
jgi:FtsZ-binding cell division protein ZapB